jgi:outer membrane receptor protein involved in Fe transport
MNIRFPLLMTISVSFTAASALAQEAPAGKASSPRELTATQALLAEVVITARKKSAAEAAQDVPISLSAVSGQQVEAQFALDLTDIGRNMPNTRLDTASVFVGVANYSIRGMGFLSTIASAEPTVGVFVDDIYLGVNIGGAPSTYDVESVEVLRGPQGTLFGRNVTAGAVVMRSRRPTGEFGGNVRVNFGNGGKKTVAGSVETPITSTLAGKVFAQWNDQDGYYHNVALNNRFGAERDVFVRPMLRWRPTSDVDVVLTAEHGRTTGDGAPARLVDDPTTAVTRSGYLAPRGTNNLAIFVPSITKLTWNQAALEANGAIGAGTLTSVTGYRNVDYLGEVGNPYPPVMPRASSNGVKQAQYSQELRYAAKAFDNKLDYTIGAYYFQQWQEQKYINASPLLIPMGFLNNDAVSGFAQGDYEFIPTWFLTAGIRYNWEEKEAKVAKGNNCDLQFNCVFVFHDKTHWSEWTPKVGFTWKPQPGLLMYASWARGFRSGGYNIRVVAPSENPGPYDPETVDSYEVGAKTEFWDRRLRFNVSGFYNKYKDLQRTVFNPLINSNQIFNAASANIPGFEMDATLMPLEDFVLSASVGYVHARYDRFDLLDVNGDGRPDPDLAKGKQLLRAPDWTYAIQATYDYHLGDRGLITPRVAYSYTSKSPVNEGNTRWLSSYGLLDASLTYTAPNGAFKISAWGKNLTNKLYALTGSYSSFQGFTIYQSPPRTYGVELAYTF